MGKVLKRKYDFNKFSFTNELLQSKNFILLILNKALNKKNILIPTCKRSFTKKTLCQ